MNEESQRRLAGLGALAVKDILRVDELSVTEVEAIYQTTANVKRDPDSYATAMQGKAAVMIFEKPSLRTRLSFEVGIAKMGGHAVFYDHARERIGERESVHDYARNLERWVDVIIARTFSHEIIERLAGYSRVPVINALSDGFHPCQALADLFTLKERLGDLAGRRIAFIGAGNNVCHSLILLAATLSMRITVISPESFGPEAEILAQAQAIAASSGGEISVSSDIARASKHDAVYTDAWTSMGQEHEAQQRRAVFTPYQVNADLMARAGSDALFMHCLPAHRGEEVTDEVIDSSNSIVFDQAENRMHTQNGLLLHLLAATGKGSGCSGPNVVTRGRPAPASA